MEEIKSRKAIVNNAIFFSYVEETIGSGESVEIVVKGMSMEPTLRNGIDRVVVSPLETDLLQLGAILLFRYNGGHVLHRLVRMGEDELIFQGDNVHTHQERARREDVVAIVEKIIYGNGEVVDCLDHSYICKAKHSVKRLSLLHFYKRKSRLLSRIKRKICKLIGFCR